MQPRFGLTLRDPTAIDEPDVEGRGNGEPAPAFRTPHLRLVHQPSARWNRARIEAISVLWCRTLR